MANVYDFSAKTLVGEELPLDSFRGKVLLVVNTASKCGFTPQYKGLETLQGSFAGRGFSVLGFPCNQFGSQEPGNADQIGQFCSVNYGVTFPMFAKIDVNGTNAHPLYQYLKKAQPGIMGLQGIKWNFTKFLVDRNGSAIMRYSPGTAPDSIAADIEKQLG